MSSVPASSRPLQLRLFDWHNPLVDRVGVEFFRSLPSSPGVYRFLSRNAEVLYVGQSRNLKQRLASYRSVHPDRSPRRLCRLVHETWMITVELADSPSAARVRENECIRDHRPRFNRANTHPETHVFLGFACDSRTITTVWTRNEEVMREWPPALRRVGALPGFSSLAALASLRRLIAFRNGIVAQADLPHALTCAQPPTEVVQELSVLDPRERERWKRHLDAWFCGERDSLLHRLTGKKGLLLHAVPEPFLRELYRRDHDTLQQFFPVLQRLHGSCYRSHRHRQKGFITQFELDDLRAAAL